MPTDPRMTPTNDAPVTVEQEKIARILCGQHGGDPDAVASEEHDCWEGPLWTAFVKDADQILAALASAPAGDGYGKWHPMLLDIVNAIHGDRGEKTQAIGIDLSYQQALAAALARPRAAVGEREA